MGMVGTAPPYRALSRQKHLHPETGQTQAGRASDAAGECSGKPRPQVACGLRHRQHSRKKFNNFIPRLFLTLVKSHPKTTHLSPYAAKADTNLQVGDILLAPPARGTGHTDRWGHLPAGEGQQNYSLQGLCLRGISPTSYWAKGCIFHRFVVLVLLVFARPAGRQRRRAAAEALQIHTALSEVFVCAWKQRLGHIVYVTRRVPSLCRRNHRLVQIRFVGDRGCCAWVALWNMPE